MTVFSTVPMEPPRSLHRAPTRRDSDPDAGLRLDRWVRPVAEPVGKPRHHFPKGLTTTGRRTVPQPYRTGAAVAAAEPVA
ncbi:hypothetical protein YW7DRAFT_02860 [Streptomyces sp. AmelKG-E11A]|nr:hypothetical protein YW7DRAFT_02860 [Streptomyces sp. AmelKG-E11A]